MYIRYAVINLNRDRLESTFLNRDLAMAHATILEHSTGQLHGVQPIPTR